MNTCRSRKSLQDIDLPSGYHLVQPVLRQRVRYGLVVRTFTLVYDGDSRLGPVEQEEPYEHCVADVMQMAWALNKLRSRVAMLRGEWQNAQPTRMDIAKLSFGAQVVKTAAQMGLPA